MNLRPLLTTALCLVAATALADAKLLFLKTSLIDNERYYKPGSYIRTPISLSTGQALLGVSPNTTTIVVDPAVTSVSRTGNPLISFANVGLTGDTLTRSGGSWISDGFTIGHAVWVDGSASNNIMGGVVTNVSPTVLTLGPTPLTAESNVGGSMTGSPSLTFAEVGETGDRITRATGSWIDDGFKRGMEITVTGTTNNNITNAYVATDPSASILTLGPTDLTAETTSSATVVGSARVRGVPNFVQTTGFNTTSAQEGGHVSGLTLDGNVVATDFPYGNTTENQAPPVANGVFLDSQYVWIVGNQIKNFRGYGALMQTSNQSIFLQSNRIDQNFIHHCWSGIRLGTDQSASGNTVVACRTHGIHVNGSAVRTTDNHCYGMRDALYVETGSEFRSSNDRFEDAEFGINWQSTADIGSFVNTRLLHNFVRGARIAGTAVTLVNPQVDIPHSSPPTGDPAPWKDKVGVEFTGASNNLIGGLINLVNKTQSGHGTPTASTGVRVTGNNCRVDTTIYDLDNLNGSRGLYIPSAIVGGEFEYRIYGFEGPGDAALDVEDNRITGCSITIIGNSTRSPGFVYNDAAQYVDISSGWGIGGNMTGGPQLTFAASSDTISRNAGSWISDGFDVGETVTITGTTNNNVTGAAITAVTATVLTLGTTSLVDEVDTTNAVTSANGTTITIKDEASGQTLQLTVGTTY